MKSSFLTAIDAGTCYCAVFGHPVRHSASPAMQNAGFAELGLNWRYLAYDVHPDDLKNALEGAKAMRFIGVNLTVPHKLLAMELVDDCEPAAREWGAINTIRFEGRITDGQWKPLRDFPDVPREVRAYGFNTDADAITRAISEELGLTFPGKKIVVLGAGGAGRTAALKIASERPAELHLINRTRAKATSVAEEIRGRFPQVQVTLDYPKGAVDLLLNATSLGLHAEDPLPLDLRAFSFRQTPAVYDMIYRPAETPFLAAAKAEGCRTANGLGMLLYQGCKALELWSGRAAPVAAMRRALEQNIYGK